jgi:hypothetical protein
MTTPFATETLAAEHTAQLRTEAAAARLAALARCCRPSTWARTARRAGQAARRLLRALRRDSGRTAVCCAGA